MIRIPMLMLNLLLLVLSGCTHAEPELGSPCRHYGSTCRQVPLNGGETLLIMKKESHP